MAQAQGNFHLNNVRINYPNLFEAKQAATGQGEAKFSAAFIFGKDHPQFAAIQKAIVDSATEKWGAKTNDVLASLKATDKLAMHDGDAKADKEGYKGNYFINASNKLRPLVVDGQRQPLTAASGTIYSGCYVNAIVQFWSQDNQFGKRVNASLLGVQFVRDGERLSGGGVASQDDFEAIPGTEAATTGANGGSPQSAEALFG